MLENKKSLMKKSGLNGYNIVSIMLILTALVTGYIFGGFQQKESAESHKHSTEDSAKDSAKIQIWTCSMDPQIRQTKPGKCPICGMDLILATDMGYGENEKDTTGRSEIALSPRAQRLAEIQVSPVKRRAVSVKIRLFGKIDYDETRISYISAWVSGRLDRLFVDYTGKLIKKGDPLVSIYSPELLTSQAELIQAIKTAKDISKSKVSSIKKTAWQTVEAAREKLSLSGLTKKQIEKIEKSDKPTDHVTIYAPMSGIVIQKNAVEGMYVSTGTKIYTIADLSYVWMKMDAYESDMPWLFVGQEVKLEVEACPGEIFNGRISFIDPFFNELTRVVKVRVGLSNHNRKLKPGMFVSAMVSAPLSEKGKAISASTESTSTEKAKLPLVIPASAPLVTGKRAVVYIKVPGNKGIFEGREIVLGPKAGDYYVVHKGLKEGEYVVTNGNFKIDSAMQIMAKPSMMAAETGKGGG